MSDVPNGSQVRFKVINSPTAQFLGATDLGAKNKDGCGSAGLRLAPHASGWENFVLCKADDGSVSVQNFRGGFLSAQSSERLSFSPNPVTLKPTDTYPTERFEVHVPSQDSDLHTQVTPKALSGETRVVALRVRAGPHSGSYIGVRDEQVQYTAEPYYWELILSKMPVISCLSVRADLERICIEEAPPILDDHPQLKAFVLQMLRAHRDFGAFLLQHHGLCSDTFTTLKSLIGALPWRDDSKAPDSQRKTHIPLCEERKGQRSYATKHWPNGFDGRSTECSAASKYMTSATQLAEALLMCLQLAQRQVLPDQASHWIGNVRKNRIIGLVALAYHPGPPGVKTTAKHTDATYITLLMQDQVGGLQIRRPDDSWVEVQTDVPDAILVNTGNVLAAASNGFFPAVCHTVDRSKDEHVASQTRLSLMLFL